MRVDPNELVRRLEKQSLPRAVLLFGDEPLLVEESLDLVRHSARAQGFADRIPLNAETGFDWSKLTHSSQTLSLFSERRLIELRLASGRPGDSGTRAIAEFCQSDAEDALLLVICERLDARTKQAKWVKALDNHGWVVEHRAVSSEQFPLWFHNRLRKKNLNLDNEAVKTLSHYLEGNLLAAAQEIDRIALYCKNDHVDTEEILEGLVDHARYNVYAFVDMCLKGDVEKALRILSSLRTEGVEPILVTWTLAKEVRGLVQIDHGLRYGQHKGALFKKYNVWSKRAPLINAALSRLEESQLLEVVKRVSRCDRVLKGREFGNIWQQIELVVLELCRVKHIAQAG